MVIIRIFSRKKKSAVKEQNLKEKLFLEKYMET
jgi:hypothetical protein